MIQVFYYIATLYIKKITVSDSIRVLSTVPRQIKPVFFLNLALQVLYAYYNWAQFCLLMIGFTQHHHESGI